MPRKEPEQKQAENLVGSLMDRIAGSGEKTSSGPVTFILLGLLVLVVSILGIKLAWAKRKAVELAVQVRRAEEERKRAEENAKLAENSTARQTAHEESKALNKEVLGLKARMARRQTEQKEMAKKLEPITSWDDIVVVDGRGK